MAVPFAAPQLAVASGPELCKDLMLVLEPPAALQLPKHPAALPGTAAAGSTSSERMVGIASVTESCLPASSACCVSLTLTGTAVPQAAAPHAPGLIPRLTAPQASPDRAALCATGEMAHRRLRRWMVPWEPG